MSVSRIESSDSGSCSSSSTSILDKLRSPTVSDLSGKRKILTNPPPPIGKRRSTTTVKKFDSKSVRPPDRVSEFPGEHLSQSAGRLFCKACREDVAVKRV